MATALERFRLRASGRIGIRKARSGRSASQERGRPRLSGPNTSASPGWKDGLGVDRLALVLKRPEPVTAQRPGGLAQVVDHLQVQVFPVVQARPAEMPVVEMKTQGPDQPEPGAGRHAGPSDRPGVGRDLGLEEDHVKPGWRNGAAAFSVGSAAAAGGVSSDIVRHLYNAGRSGAAGPFLGEPRAARASHWSSAALRRR